MCVCPVLLLFIPKEQGIEKLANGVGLVCAQIANSDNGKYVIWRKYNEKDF